MEPADADHALVAEFLDGFSASMRSGESVIGMPEWSWLPWLDEDQILQMLRASWPAEVHVPHQSSDGAEGICGIDKFEYPKNWVEEKISIAGGFAWWIGVRFKAVIKFKDGGIYNCECCELKQFAETDGFSPAASGRKPHPAPDPGTPHEDTRSKVDGTSGAERGTPVPAPTWHFGSEQDWKMPGHGGGISYQNVTTPCLVRMLDTPGVPMSGAGRYNLTFRFTGRVFDVCNNNKVVHTEKFSIKLSGNIPKSGGTPSGGATVYGYGGALADTPTHKVANDGSSVRLK
ncbi:MAG: hypothetical protein P1V36_02050 [Planctomycetota bacterium]|nr:hypothetical protein [Planctomycetota bacterium]